MLRLLLIVMSVLLIASCGGANTALHNMQLSGDAEPFPADYQARALRYLGEPVAAGVMISDPQTMVGETALSPKRWYVCLAGLVPAAPPPGGAKPLLEAASDLVRPGSDRGVYQVILILRASGAVSALKGFDSPLCSSGRFARLAAV